ncbi:MAG: phosphoribosylformylglycinamidine synthase subunit PurL [Chloroflexi bacterium]|nr:MAG: phosphoribosylformylglycinamidine synthase subunit PurL [Chloroflexota bacterium]
MSVSDTTLREVALSRSEYDQVVVLLGREPTPVELGMFGAMWSEHCGYKNSRPLLKLFPTSGERVLQGPGENAGAVDIGDGLAVVFKIESHNHPSAVEPYEGAATGVGGIVRDIFTMGARPIALLNSLRFGPLERPRNRYLFQGVVGGIGGYGNCLGIPTVAGDIFFDPAYNGNPLVNAMCVGIVQHDAIMKARASGIGNLVVLVGADTGRDGIHGATFASVENPEESHRGVVQVGNPFLEKLLLEACLEVLQTEHVVAMQDLGAAGLTSSTVECASRGNVGIEIDVQYVSRREQGMNAYEIMLSESQERMLVIVREDGLDEVRAIFSRWDLHSDVIGRVTGDGHVRVLDHGVVVADVPAAYFVDACPTYVRDGIESPEARSARLYDCNSVPDIAASEVIPWLRRLLASPNICSREPVVRTYDHTILSNTILAPLEGDAAVVRIKGTTKALALKTDCNPRYVYLDPFQGGKYAVAEAARNVSCTGATPLALTNCLNFGSPEKPAGYFQLREAVRGMAEAARVLNTPVVSGNVSLFNESENGSILPTPTVGMVGILDDASKRVGLAANAGDALLLLGPPAGALGASEYLALRLGANLGAPPPVDLDVEARVQALVRNLIQQGLVTAAHDTSEGGLLVAIVEMLIPQRVGATLDLDAVIAASLGRVDGGLFGESASRIIVATPYSQRDVVERLAASAGIPVLTLGVVGGSQVHIAGVGEVEISDLCESWSNGLR